MCLLAAEQAFHSYGTYVDDYEPISGDLLFQECSPLPKFSAWIRRRRRNFAVMALLPRRIKVYTVTTLCKQLPRCPLMIPISTDKPSHFVIGRKPEE
jgi:hypothetical protein